MQISTPRADSGTAAPDPEPLPQRTQISLPGAAAAKLGPEHLCSAVQRAPRDLSMFTDDSKLPREEKESQQV